MPRKRKKKSEIGYLRITIITAAIVFSVITTIFIIYGDRFIKGGVSPGKRPFHVNIYFSGSKGTSLRPQRWVLRERSIEGRIEESMKRLVAGPRYGYTSTIPQGTRLLGVSIKDNTAYLNFSKEISSNHTGGSSAEVQTVYSIVNTVTLNFGAVKRVQILVDGAIKQTLAGHIEIDVPLLANMEIIGGKYQ